MRATGSEGNVNRDVTNEEIAEYYVKTHSLYNVRWSLDSHKSSIHIGYFDDNHTSLGEAVENMKRNVAKAVDIGPDDHVLDAGCGLGETAAWIAANRGANVTGINITEHQIKLGRDLARDNGVANRVDIQYDDFTEMATIDDDSVDVVWGLESICYADDKREFLEQAKRVLKPDGRIVVADAFMTQRDLTPDQRDSVRKWLDGWKLPNFAHTDGFMADLEDLGFENVSSDDITEHIMPSSKSLYRISLVGYPVLRLLELVGVTNEYQSANMLACYHQRKAFEQELASYCIVSAEL